MHWLKDRWPADNRARDGFAASEWSSGVRHDAGQTWVRIDDDQHQYGSADVPMIIGDPRIYGRVYVTTGGRGVIYGDISSAK